MLWGTSAGGLVAPQRKAGWAVHTLNRGVLHSSPHSSLPWRMFRRKNLQAHSNISLEFFTVFSLWQLPSFPERAKSLWTQDPEVNILLFHIYFKKLLMVPPEPEATLWPLLLKSSHASTYSFSPKSIHLPLARWGVHGRLWTRWPPGACNQMGNKLYAEKEKNDGGTGQHQADTVSTNRSQD